MNEVGAGESVCGPFYHRLFSFPSRPHFQRVHVSVTNQDYLYPACGSRLTPFAPLFLIMLFRHTHLVPIPPWLHAYAGDYDTIAMR